MMVKQMAHELSFTIEDFLSKFTSRVCFGIKIRQFLISGRLPCPMVRGMADTVKVQSDLDPLEGIDSLRLENEMKNYLIQLGFLFIPDMN